jgi:hypothetical protein
MATHGEKRMNGHGAPPAMEDGSRWSRSPFPGTGGDEWHRVLTGRQSPEPVSAKLRMIYGTIVAEELPDRMLDLLSRLDQKRPE